MSTSYTLFSTISLSNIRALYFEQQIHREKGVCYRYRDKFAPGHCSKLGMFTYLELMQEENAQFPSFRLEDKATFQGNALIGQLLQHVEIMYLSFLVSNRIEAVIYQQLPVVIYNNNCLSMYQKLSLCRSLNRFIRQNLKRRRKSISIIFVSGDLSTPYGHGYWLMQCLRLWHFV